MRISAWIRIVCWGVIFLLLTGILICGLTGIPFCGVSLNAWEDFSWKADSCATLGNGSGNYHVSTEGIKQLDISWTSGEITLISYEGEDVYFTETSDTPLNEKNSLRYGVSDGVLVIRFQEKGSLFGRQPDKKLQVMIPRSLASDLREVQADAVSANIRIEKLEAEKITCTATSGAVALTGLQAGRIETETVSGDITVSSVQAEEIEISTVSGEMDLEGAFQKISSSSTSGALKVNSSICPTSFKASSVSGGVTLFIPENNGFSLSFDKVSGAFYSDFSMTLDNGKGIYRDGGNLLIVDTVSGNCSIRRNK